jgi:hypothetical protein
MRKRTSRWAAVGGVAALALLAAACGGGDDTKTVTAVDYRFDDLPSSVKAGTTLTLKNGSDKELHEMVLARLPDGETRSVEELMRLPEDQLGALFSGPPALVMFAPPGDGEPILAVGDGKLSEKGRYLVMCSIPTGADPAAFLQAAQNSSGGPPEVAGGPPHFTHGMYGEITVK